MAQPAPRNGIVGADWPKRRGSHSPSHTPAGWLVWRGGWLYRVPLAHCGILLGQKLAALDIFVATLVARAAVGVVRSWESFQAMAFNACRLGGAATRRAPTFVELLNDYGLSRNTPALRAEESCQPLLPLMVWLSRC